YNNQIHRIHVATSVLANENIEQELSITDLDYYISNNSDVEEEITTKSHNQKNQSLEENEDLVLSFEYRIKAEKTNTVHSRTTKITVIIDVLINNLVVNCDVANLSMAQ
ncbi:18009_t:CDS:2, partial [Racocetra fulgida]